MMSPSEKPGLSPVLKPPGVLLLALEGRAPWEFGVTFAALPWLMKAPRGDGHGVIVFPGLAASDASTLPPLALAAEPECSAASWSF